MKATINTTVKPIKGMIIYGYIEKVPCKQPVRGQ